MSGESTIDRFDSQARARQHRTSMMKETPWQRQA